MHIEFDIKFKKSFIGKIQNQTSQLSILFTKKWYNRTTNLKICATYYTTTPFNSFNHKYQNNSNTN